MIAALEQALALSPDNAPLRMQLAALCVNAERWPDAETHYKHVLSTDPSDLKAKLGLANVFRRTDRLSAAIVVYDELHDRGMRDPELLLAYSRALAKEGSTGKAQQVYQELIARAPGMADAELDGLFRVGGQEGYGDDDEDDDGLDSLLIKPDEKFADVGGMDAVKKEIALKIIMPFRQPELYKAYNKKAGGGILLYGPPGCGKTFIAKATAGEIDARFVSVGISDVLDMWIGNSEKNLAGIFGSARNNTPCVLFFDEIDALGANRSHMKQSGGRHLINQFLSEMDGTGSANEGILIMGATNAPWHMDPAFRRPGRFDRIIFVPPPDQEGRKRILDLLLRGMPAEDVDTMTIAKVTEHFSGADLKAVIDTCVEDKLADAFTSGKPEPITTKDLKKAAGKLKPTTREWFNSAKNYALYANDGGLYDEILKYVK
ncbi:MAG: AAA family ATPase [Flavobacteriales bacterium]|nr:AAA family ATPase [Flavobacteriales bacterium]